MAVAANNQMVVHGDTQFLARLANLFGYFNIGGRRCRIPAWMIVDEYNGRSVELQCPLNDLAWIERHVIDRTFLLRFIRDQRIAIV